MVRLKKIISLILLTLLLASCTLQRAIKKADQRYEIGEYHAAAMRYKRVLSRIPAKEKKLQAAVAFRLGECYRLIHDPRRAEAAYRKAVRYKAEDSILYLHYGDVLLRNGRPREARSAFYRYLRYDSTNARALNAIIACDSLRAWEKAPQRFAVSQQPELNGRKADDFSPFFINDNQIIFTSTRTAKGAKKVKNSKITGIPNSRLFSAKRNRKGTWDTPEPLPDAINSVVTQVKGTKQIPGDVGVASVSPDGKTLFFTAAPYDQTKSQGAQTYASTRQAGEWGEPKLVAIFPDSSLSVAHPSLASDGFLYFVTDAPGGYGGKDIWRCRKKTKDSWDTPENLGPDINTQGDEMFPIFAPDGTLYFSSDGHPSMGGLDLYAASYLFYDTLNAHPRFAIRHLPVPFNSSGDDFSLTTDRQHKQGFFSSNRNDPKGLDHIYSFGEPDVEFSLAGTVSDFREQPLPDAVIRVVGTDGTNRRVNVHRDGTYSFPLDKGVDYVLLASCRGHLNGSAKFSTVGIFKNMRYTQNFTLPSMLQPVPINNIFFDFAQYTLRPESQNALDSLVQMLNDNPHVTIRIEAHTDMIGSDAFNIELSNRRAEAVVNYLSEHGIDRERLDFKGYGESSPVVVDEQLALQYHFLKQDQTLSEDFVLSLPEAQRDIVNQINRRIEFVVTRTTYRMY